MRPELRTRERQSWGTFLLFLGCGILLDRGSAAVAIPTLAAGVALLLSALLRKESTTEASEPRESDATILSAGAGTEQ